MRAHILPAILTLASVSQAAPRAHIVDDGNAPSNSAHYSKVVSEGVTLHLVSFDSRRCQLKVVDQAGGPGSQWRDASSLGKSKNALACINAGFFNPDGSPLGVVIADGTARGSNNKSSLGSGFFFSNGQQSGIERRSSLYSIRKQYKPSQLLQSGPTLSFRGAAITGLSKTNSRVRSFIATDGAYGWLIGYAETATLDQLGKALTGKTLGDVKIYHAINLDGGRSSDLWVSPEVSNGNKTFRAIWNKPVRNFLILTKK